MEYVFLLLGSLFVILGLVGSFLPVLPDAPLSWLGILMLYFCDGVETDYWLLGITLLIAIVAGILDYVIPAKGTKRFGGSSYGIWGTNIGLIVGLIAPIPFGFVIGPFLGAFIGEMMFDSKDQKRALKAATGSFVGFLASTFMKFVVCMAFLGLFVYKVWDFREVWF